VVTGTTDEVAAHASVRFFGVGLYDHFFVRYFALGRLSGLYSVGRLRLRQPL
jgi:hypothetical protein